MTEVASPKKKTQTQIEMTEVLLDFTEQVFLPAMNQLEERLDQKFDQKLEQRLKVSNAQLENNLKTYIDRRLTDNNIELLKKLDEKYFKKDTAFKQKTVELFKRHKIGTPKDVKFLEGNIAVS